MKSAVKQFVTLHKFSFFGSPFQTLALILTKIVGFRNIERFWEVSLSGLTVLILASVNFSLLCCSLLCHKINYVHIDFKK